MLKDALNYDEPSDWSIPVRQDLGAALRKDRRFAEALAFARSHANLAANCG